MLNDDNIENQEDDIVFDNDEGHTSAISGLQSKNTKKLRKEIKEARSKAQEYLEGWQRAKADLINSKRENDESKQKFAQFANQDLISQLLPVLDSFELALEHINDQGVKQIYGQLLSVLNANGIEQTNPLGETFDPTTHESIAVDIVENKNEEHTIVRVMQKGYTLYDKIIRVPKVHVGELKK